MAMSAEQIFALQDAHVIDADGEDLGGIDQVFLDSETQDPAWVTIGASIFDGPQRFVPLAGAQITETEVRVPYTKALIAGAPRFADAAGGHHADGLHGNENPYLYYGLAAAPGTLNAHPGATE
ncbi:PRC-barrel domain-containing protein [Nakamurella lactea]|uniref:PRC-barrel domain-containing protein n=1 Tax=Nakamurella lactea TaxID=459515 RepID=UPI0003FE78FE|nr:PRC-barrel domain-containing protein [Nakamurella lactea]